LVAGRLPGENGMRLPPPVFQVVGPLRFGVSVLGVGDVVGQTHVGIEREHRGALGRRKQAKAVVKVLSVALREALAPLPGEFQVRWIAHAAEPPLPRISLQASVNLRQRERAGRKLSVSNP